MSNTIIIFVPGTTGSTLVGPNQSYDAPLPVWPDSVYSDLLNPLHNAADREQSALDALERQDLRPGRVQRSGLQGATSYTKFIEFFSGNGYTPVDAVYAAANLPAENWGLPAGPLTGNLLVAFPYDWRNDCTNSAQDLQSLLSAIDKLYAVSDYQVVLVGHSMGGLVCRAYLESVGASDSWRENIRALVTLGTPHLGAPLALSAILGQMQLTVPNMPASLLQAVETLAHNFVDTAYSDSSFELLPPAAPAPGSRTYTAFIQDGDNAYNPGDADLPADVQTAIASLSAVGLPTTDEYTRDLQEAAAFFSNLDYTGQGSLSLPAYYCVAGTGISTAQSFTYETTAQSQSLQLVSTTAGDGIVPQWSAAFAGRTVQVVDTYSAPGVAHGQLPGDAGVLGHVATWVAAAVAAPAGAS